ncbi:MAG: hypothetical protein R3B51_01035 [Thermodesulfobacteriota bacterium]
MGEVHATALQAIGDYSNGLSQYATACVETDSNIKSEYAERGWQNLVSADNKIRQVNSLITSPSAAAAAPLRIRSRKLPPRRSSACAPRAGRPTSACRNTA